MKCVCISCFDHYATRMKDIISFFQSKNADVTYVLSDYQHFEKKRFVANYDNCIQVHVPSYKKNLSAKRLLSHSIFSKKVYKILKEKKPDVIYCIFPPNSLVKYINKYKKKNNPRVIFDCYDMWPESFPYSKSKKILRLPFSIWRNVREKNIECADLIICVSKTAEEYWSKNHPLLRTKVLMPAIAFNEMPNYSFDTSLEINLLYLGNINHITDIDFGVRLLSKVAAKKKTILHIIGEGNKKSEFVEKLEKNNVRVVSYGVVFNEKQKVEIFSKCVLGLNIPRTEIHSSMPLKGIEYLQKGLPFINTGEGDINSFVKKYKAGLNVNLLNEDIDFFANAIVSIDKVSLQSMSDNCRECYLKEFSNQGLSGIFDGLL